MSGTELITYIAGIVRRPFGRPQLEDVGTGVFGVLAVPETKVGVVSTLDLEHHQVVLVHVGQI